MLTHPTSTDLATEARWREQRLRERLMRGAWEEDLTERLKQAIGHVRSEAWGAVDLSSNMLNQTASELSVLYDRPDDVQIAHEDQDAGALMLQLLRSAQWAPLMQWVQTMTLGVREYVLAVDVTDAGELTLRPVAPHLIEATPDPDHPDRPVVLSEWRPRNVDGTQAWTRTEYDIRGDGSLRVYTERDEDITAKVLGQRFEGAKGSTAYPYRDANDKPVLRHVIYHASATGRLWDHTRGKELVQGTLQAGVYWTFFGHCLRNSSWQQRWSMGLAPVGASLEDENGDGRSRSRIVADPSTIIAFEFLDDGDRANLAKLGQFEAGSDPATVYDAVSRYEQRVATFAGVSASDFVRMSGDPRSGYALSISREGKRDVARRMEPVFAAADAALCRTVAVLRNSWARRTDGASALRLPEDGYSVRYNALPPTPEEQRQRREHVFELLDRGLITRVRAYAELWSVDEARAAVQLAEIDRVKAGVRSAPEGM